MPIVLPDNYGYPLLAVTSSYWLMVWQTTLVGLARKAAGIPYPQLYAEKDEAASSQEAHKYNCVQRAHQNTIETITLILSATLIAGIKYPICAALFCGSMTLSRIAYTLGYSSGVPEKRNANGVHLVSTVSLVVGKARKAAHIAYPQLYAEKDEALMSKSARIFNCVQRSHQNTLEHITMIVSSTLIAGLSRPGLAASLCISWVLGRVSYTIGYSTGDAAKRNSWGAPLVTAATQISLVVYATLTAYQLVVA
ncbi:hypothetical protein EW026_g2555 [Hermanssonia centrifuga]|uniref:Microsomal glutathione S-transferase 3 n=1 Tax=Hermanssonia centrifuga TaxID=98765 RepID=A0A4S4KMV5_9APHY|nr:hypothetical protein EW026_g2555 [Hermanssonia centrifuga]